MRAEGLRDVVVFELRVADQSPAGPKRRKTMLAAKGWADAPTRPLGFQSAHPSAPTTSGRILTTERLALRWWRLDDTENLFRIFGDPGVHEHSGSQPYENSAAARCWLEREVVAAPARGFGHWAVVERATGEVVGSCGFRAGPEPRELEIGFTIARSRWGRGYATEIAAACLRFGADHLAATTLLSLTQPGNQAARRVLEKIGLELRGEERHDDVLWCVYAMSGPAAAGLRPNIAEEA